MWIAHAGLPNGVKQSEWCFDDHFPNIQDNEGYFHLLKQFLTAHEDDDHRRLRREKARQVSDDHVLSDNNPLLSPE